ncbi:DUF6984 family protein [Pseudomonas shirazensis]
MELIILEEYMKHFRKLTSEEKKLIDLLIIKSNYNLKEKNWADNLLVKSMNDGQMGSLYLCDESLISDKRFFGKMISEHLFLDVDGVTVIASLNIDKDGNLFELDIWKTDYSPLIKYPDNYDLIP